MILKRVAIALDGLSCGGGGVLMVERELKKVPGVQHVYANPATEMAYVEYDSMRATAIELRRAVERAGFRAGEFSVR
jgi:copper chaperone CopZ